MKKEIKPVIFISVIMVVFSLFVSKSYADDRSFKIIYHPEEGIRALTDVSVEDFDRDIDTKSISELGYSKDGYKFVGWKVYRESDGKWYMSDKSGKCSFEELKNGKPPVGYKYELCKDGTGAGTHLVKSNVLPYGKWGHDIFKVLYHDIFDHTISKKTSDAYGDPGIFAADRDLSAGDLHFFGIWREDNEDKTVINVADHGADGSDKADDRESIQKCLDHAKDHDGRTVVKIPPGTYYLNSDLRIYSDTTLELDDKAKIVRTNQNKAMLISDNENGAGGYGQCRNIRVVGGTWDGNGSPDTAAKALIKFQHGENITLKNCVIENVCSRHMAGFSGIKNLTVKDVTFKNQYIYTGNDVGEGSAYSVSIINNNYPSMEALHLDYISSDGRSEPGSVPWDDTNNKNTKVIGCHFENVISGLGSHYLAGDVPKSSGAVVDGNTFENVKCTGIHLCNHTGATISNNSMDRCGEGIRVNRFNGDIKNNVINLDASEINKTDGTVAERLYGMIVYDDSEVRIYGNTINNSVRSSIVISDSSSELLSNSISGSSDCGIIAKNAAKGLIAGNKIDNSAKHGVYLKNAFMDVVGNEVYSSGNTGMLVNMSQATGDLVNISNNTVSGSGDRGIQSKGSDNINIIRNTVSHSTNHGIELYNTCDNSIKKNEVTESGKTGIMIKNSENVLLENNISKNNVSKDIYVNDDSTGTAVGNDTDSFGIKVKNPYFFTVR